MARSGSATAASISRPSRSISASTLGRSNRSTAYSRKPDIPAGRPSAPGCSVRLIDRSTLAVAVSTDTGTAVNPPGNPSRSTGALFCSTSATWNSG